MGTGLPFPIRAWAALPSWAWRSCTQHGACLGTCHGSLSDCHLGALFLCPEMTGGDRVIDPGGQGEAGLCCTCEVFTGPSRKFPPCPRDWGGCAQPHPEKGVATQPVFGVPEGRLLKLWVMPPDKPLLLCAEVTGGKGQSHITGSPQLLPPVSPRNRDLREHEVLIYGSGDPGTGQTCLRPPMAVAQMPGS